uniref:Methyltransferase n=1 Tax=OCS116 cluster bacterium TaxID=2030921 RepID=A0A2A4YYJ6_9PROT
MTKLGAHLIERIKARGPLNMAEYMDACLLHPTLGYYTTRPVFGAQGDFTTAPEISQMFGEMIGLSLAQAWLDSGAPAAFVLAELGPGRGTLMADILRATNAVPGFTAAAQVHLVEASPRLRDEQAETVPRAMWHDSIDELPELPLFLIANEFFDALPLRQFTRTEDSWSERMVGLSGGALSISAAAPAAYAPLETRLGDTDPGDIVELCPALPGIITEIGRRIDAHGGAALIIDYGHDGHGFGDSLQAVKAHKYAKIFKNLGKQDITAHVNFTSLKEAGKAQNLMASPVVTQAHFLGDLAIGLRAQMLIRKNPEQEMQIAQALNRLIGEDEMGTLFKVLCLHNCEFTPVGFGVE